jgi:hypothetical protein
VQGEAQAARDRLSRDPQNLTDHSKTDHSITTPYKWDEISETAKHAEILIIVANAGPQTRPYYGMGRYMTNVNEENWVARWYLWHSFRYRFVKIILTKELLLTIRCSDNRDNRTRGTANSSSQVYSGKQQSGEPIDGAVRTDY